MIMVKEKFSLASLEKITMQPVLKPFAKVLIDFVEALSNSILLSKVSRQYPELIAMAHWLRRAHVFEIHKEFELRQQNKIWLARGTALHFAPANVDTIFMYSWILSLLVGNNNIVRLSSRGSKQVNLLLSLIETLLEESQFQKIKAKNALIRYERNNHVTKTLSNYCDIRIIWGGDNTVNAIRQIPLPPHAKELTFSNKFSMALLNARSLINSEQSDLEDLVHGFYNDSFWFDQLACSSPRVVLWLGTKKCIEQAKVLFWQELTEYCKKRKLLIEPARQMMRITQLFELGSKNWVSKMNFLSMNSPCFSHAELTVFDQSIRDHHQGGELFLEYSVQDLDEITPLLNKKDQTLSVYGFERAVLNAWIEKLPSPVFDRIVPIGEALQFQTTWDGYALLQEFTREVSIAL